MKPLHLAVVASIAVCLFSPVAAGPYLPSPDELGRHIRIKEQIWALDGGGNILVVKIKLKKSAAFALKDFVIGCVAVAESGTVVGTPRTTLYQVLQPKKLKTFPGVSVGFVNSQTKRVGCEVLSASRSD